jgi:hypothetical protein
VVFDEADVVVVEPAETGIEGADADPGEPRVSEGGADAPLLGVVAGEGCCDSLLLLGFSLLLPNRLLTLPTLDFSALLSSAASPAPKYPLSAVSFEEPCVVSCVRTAQILEPAAHAEALAVLGLEACHADGATVLILRVALNVAAALAADLEHGRLLLHLVVRHRRVRLGLQQHAVPQRALLGHRFPMIHSSARQ